MEKDKTSRQPVQSLLDFAEKTWGPSFDADGEQLWWCDEKLDPKYLIATNGVEFFAETEVGVLKVELSEDNIWVFVSRATVRIPEDT